MYAMLFFFLFFVLYTYIFCNNFCASVCALLSRQLKKCRRGSKDIRQSSQWHGETMQDATIKTAIGDSAMVSTYSKSKKDKEHEGA